MADSNDRSSYRPPGMPPLPSATDTVVGPIDEIVVDPLKLPEPQPLPEVQQRPSTPRQSSPTAPSRKLPVIGHFGPYAIVGRLAMGGMAEILLAREDSEVAGSRYLVVKRILPEYENEQAFIDMFLDEARVVMRLAHPNVCHIYKFGLNDGTPFIAMEWVNGTSLGKLIRRARKYGGLPASVACKIISNIAEALDHAHAAKDEEGDGLGIIHRDVTPDNIMISFEGAVKLLDFGIAKANVKAHKTQAGIVKGKFAYMAPEQCRAKELDHRVDIFAMGVCLYESLTGRPLYRRETEFETMEAIVRGPIPKLADRIESPPETLERIIARCLAKRPEERFSTAGALQEALDHYIADRGKVVTGGKLKKILAKLFPEELQRGPSVDTSPFGSSYNIQDPAAANFELMTSEAALNEFSQFGATPQSIPGLVANPGPSFMGAPAPPEIQRGTPTPNGPPSAARISHPQAAPHQAAPHQAAPHQAAQPNNVGDPMGRPSQPQAMGPVLQPAPVATRPSSTYPPNTAPRRGRINLFLGVGIVAVFGIVGALAAFLMFRSSEETLVVQDAPIHVGSASIQSIPSGAMVTVDGESQGVTPLVIYDLTTGSHEITLALDGYATNAGSFEVRADAQTPVNQTLTPESETTPTETGTLTLTSTPTSVQVFLRDERLGTTPLRGVEVPVPSGGVLPLNFVTENGERLRSGVVVRPNEETSTHVNLADMRR